MLSNKCTPEIVYSSAYCGTVRYGNTVRNGHETVPARCLHCTALNENGNFFCPLLYMNSYSRQHDEINNCDCSCNTMIKCTCTF